MSLFIILCVFYFKNSISSMVYRQKIFPIIYHYNQSQIENNLKMKNIQRQSLQNYKSGAPQSACNTQTQYFPINFQKKQIRPYMEQSTILRNQLPEQYQKLARMYQKQNEEIQAKNNQLLDVVRELKDKQSDLLAQISSLQNYYRKLLNNFQRIQENKQNQILNSQIINIKQLTLQSQQKRIVNNHEQYKRKLIKSPSTPVMQNQLKLKPQQTQMPIILQSERQNFIKSLNDEFCKLVQESINEKDSIKRKKLRKQLAELASQMKKIRSTQDYKPLLKQSDKQYELTKKKQAKFQSPSSKSLAPYLDIKNTGNTEVKQSTKNKLNHYNSYNQLQKLKNNTVVTNCQNLLKQ